MFVTPESRNNKGQVRAKPIRDALNALLTRSGDDPLTDKPKTLAQKIAMDLMRDAVYGNKSVRTDARSEVIDRTDGKDARELAPLLMPVILELSCTVVLEAFTGC
jgi:hypothetical protein